jgi:hypothetical protein
MEGRANTALITETVIKTENYPMHHEAVLTGIIWLEPCAYLWTDAYISLHAKKKKKYIYIYIHTHTHM